MKFAPLALLLVAACATTDPAACDHEAAHITRNTQIGRAESFQSFRSICLANQRRRSTLGQIAEGAAEAEFIFDPYCPYCPSTYYRPQRHR